MNKSVAISVPAILNWTSKDIELVSLILNMMGGLQYTELLEDEKQLLANHGYSPTTKFV